VRACYERELVLLRPDQYVAWRSDHVPENWNEILDTVTGQACTGADGEAADIPWSRDVAPLAPR